MAPVHVFVPYRGVGQTATSPYYDTTEFRGEIGDWFEADRPWQWQIITLAQASITTAIEAARQANAIILNLCDGDEADGYPGQSVVAALAEAGLGYSGADPAFYALSTSKLAMKRCFERASLPTAPFLEIAHDSDLSRVQNFVGFPCILKLDISSDGIGMTCRSVGANEESLKRQMGRLTQEGLIERRPYVERFIAGRELSVLVIEDETEMDGLRAFPPVECVFNPAIPVDERILFKGHRDFDAHGNLRKDGGEARVDYRVAEAALHGPLTSLAKASFRALQGVGYARVDMRIGEKDGAVVLLEVNANCSLSRDEPSIAPGLAAAGWRFSDFVHLMLRKADRVAL